MTEELTIKKEALEEPNSDESLGPGDELFITLL